MYELLAFIGPVVLAPIVGFAAVRIQQDSDINYARKELTENVYRPKIQPRRRARR